MSMGANVSVVDKEGKSPMDYAEQLGLDMIAILKGNHYDHFAVISHLLTSLFLFFLGEPVDLPLDCGTNSPSENQSPGSKVCNIL